MSLYKSWMEKAFSKEGQAVEEIWNVYLPKEQKIYEYILGEKIDKLEMSLKEFGEKFDLSNEEAVAFMDGINEALPKAQKVESMTARSKVVINIEHEKLFKKMVEYQAKHLYSLPQWDDIFDDDTKKRLTLEQKKSRTIVKEEKIGRNDACPCGSGKKYKKCCGLNV